MAKNIINIATLKIAGIEDIRRWCKQQHAVMALAAEAAVDTPEPAQENSDDMVNELEKAAPVAQEVTEDILDGIDGATVVASMAQEVTPVEEPDLSEYADGEVVPSCFTDKNQPVVAPEKGSEKAKKTFKGVSMKEMTLDQLHDKMSADINEFKFIEDDRVRRSKMGTEIISGARKTDGFIDRNMLESIVAKYNFGVTGYLILKKNNILPQEIIDSTQKILADLLQHWVKETKVLSIAALQLRERVEGAGCKGTGYRHKDCSHPLYKGYKVWQEVSSTEWDAVMASRQYRYMVFKVNVGGSNTTPKTTQDTTPNATEQTSQTAQAATQTTKQSKEDFKKERDAIWKVACEQFNGVLSIPTGEDRTTPRQIQQRVTGLLKIKGVWVARVETQWDAFYTYDVEYGKFYGTNPLKASAYAKVFDRVASKKNA